MARNSIVAAQTSKPHLAAVLQALLVVFLWATSWVLIKIGLQQIPPLVFAGLRYMLAFLVLLAASAASGAWKEIASYPKKVIVRLMVLGILFYAVTQGASFVALAYLPAVTVNLLWSFSSILVAVLGIAMLSEKLTLLQWSGTGLALLGAMVYFYPASLAQAEMLGVLVAILGICANAISAVLGREVNRTARYQPMALTMVSMGAGAVLLMGAGVAAEGFPHIDGRGWAIIAWLALVNTAFAFTLWNHTLRTLSAIESSILNSTMLIWIPLLAVLFLGEGISERELAGLLITATGTVLVQLRRNPFKRKATA